MKIKSIIANNFKKYDEVKFAPEKTIYATIGHNGAGKTTLQQIIQYALTGDLPTNPIRNGEDELEVSCLLADGTDFTRINSKSKPSKVKLNGKTTTGKMLREHLELSTKVPLEGLKLASSADLISNMKPEQFSEFIRQFIPEDLDFEIIKDYMGPIEPDVLKMAEDYIPTKGSFGTDKLIDVYNLLTEQRKVYKREMDVRKARISEVIEERPAETLADVNKKLEDLLKEEGAIESAKLALKTYEKAVEGQKKQKELISSLEKAIETNKSKRPNVNELTSIKTQKAELNNQIIDISSLIKTMKDTIDTFKETIEKLDSSFCPLSESIECKNSKDRISLKQEFEEQINAQNEGIKIQQKMLDNINEKMKKLDDEENAYEENKKAYQNKLILLQQLDNAKKAMPSLPPKPIKVDPEAKDYEEEKKVLNKTKSTILRWEQRDKSVKELELFSKDWKAADTLIKLLAPKGPVMAKITQYYFDVFEDVCNEKAKILKHDFSIKFVTDNGVRILCETSAGAGYIPYECASSGERAYVLFILMDLISNALTKANIMILDDLDKLDSEAFTALMDLITSNEVKDAYDHIIISAVDHEDTIATLKKYPDIELHVLS